MDSTFYLAYGSNLNVEDWSNWCRENGFDPSLLRFYSIGYLPDHDICFDFDSQSRDGGVLDIKPRLGQAVPGVIFEVRGKGWEALDKKEGAPHCYERVNKTAIDDHGREVAVVTYQVRADRRKSFVAPNGDYVRVVRTGLEFFGLSTWLLEAAAENKETPWLCDALFVYGTLMRGESRFRILESCGLECILLAETYGRLVDLGGYPGMVDTMCDRRMVQGEFVRVRDISRAIEELDRIEGFQGFGERNSLFQRTLLEVGVGDGRVRLAWAYCLVANADDALEIPSGDWREHRGIRRDFLKMVVAGHTDGDDARIAAKIATQLPFSYNPDSRAVAESLIPIRTALESGTVSERRLAQASGRWIVVP